MPLEFHLRLGETAGSRPLHAEVRLAHADIIGASDHSRQGACKILRPLARCRFLFLSHTLALFALLLPLGHLPVNSCYLLGSEAQTLWDLCATKTAVLQSPVVEHPLASRTLIPHTRSWFNVELSRSRRRLGADDAWEWQISHRLVQARYL